MGAHQSMDMVGQDIWVLPQRETLPYMRKRYPDFVCVLFCWVSAGFWTALMGFPATAYRAIRRGISASTVGDDFTPQSEHRTALIMPIAMKTLARFRRSARDTGSVETPGKRRAFRRLYRQRQL